MRISLIITTKNETKTISRLLDSIANQTRKVDELIITVAGENSAFPTASWDVSEIKKSGTDVKIITLHQSANRAVGRNRAIEAATYEHILITDAGCVLHPDWVAHMIKGFEKSDVVAGYYEGEYSSVFEKCEIPYVLVMPDKINTESFLPATRSMGITKTAWEKVGTFNEHYRYAEDYEFARRLQAKHIPITVVPAAIVTWRPRKNLWAFARMIFEHAFGDAYSRTFRPKVLTIYLRYLLLIAVGVWYWAFGIGALLVYFAYAIQKNYRYVNDPQALGWLPLLQVVSDFAVMWGTVLGSVSARFT